jgi:FkbM family methyltransferase
MYINKPEYFFQPINIIQKYFGNSAIKNTDLSGLLLHTFKGDYIARALKRTGVYDLALTEVIWQLSKKGGGHVDVGANIGYISRIMQLKAGASGKTISFEPNPEVLPILKQNRIITPDHINWVIYPMAVGEKKTELWLKKPGLYHNNHGTAHIISRQETDATLVQVSTLDSMLKHEKIDLMKIDVEGFEWEVIQGALGLISAGNIENIVYEDFSIYPGRIYSFLKSIGYQVFAIRKGWRNVLFYDPKDAPPVAKWEEPNYLATKLNIYQLNEKFSKPYTCFKEIKRAVIK